jgi:hypothetical protein
MRRARSLFCCVPVDLLEHWLRLPENRAERGEADNDGSEKEVDQGSQNHFVSPVLILYLSVNRSLA